MLNMQMSNRIVRRWIGSPSWFASQQSTAVAQGSAESPGQNEQPAADAPENVWTWSRLYSLTRILIDSGFCLSVWECVWHLSSLWRSCLSQCKMRKNIWRELYYRASICEETDPCRPKRETQLLPVSSESVMQKSFLGLLELNVLTVMFYIYANWDGKTQTLNPRPGRYVLISFSLVCN